MQKVRIERAKRLLERSEHSFAAVRSAVGYRDGGAFRALFARHVGMSPSDGRASFWGRPDG